jgi:phospholipid/cholesterol/gamma-HCH transport system substrate-binding protein
MRGLLAPLVKLVVFLVVTAFATYVLGATIANTTYGSTTSYRADFTDAAGLEVGDDVRIAGVRVGSVTSIKVVQHNLAQISFSVIKSRSLPTSVIARLRYRNLIGQRYIDIEQGVGDPNRILKRNGLIPASQTENALDLTTLFEGFQPLFQGLNATQINDLSNEIIQALQGEGGSLDLLFTNLADLTNTIANKESVIGDLIDNLSSVLTAVGSRDTELSNLILQLQGFVSGLAQDRQSIGDSIDGINALATSTAGLLTQVRAPLAKDITDLTALTDNLNANKSTLQFVLQSLPPTLAGLIRTASYGSWFNFYLCSVGGTITLPGAVNSKPLTYNLNTIDSTQARCQ